MRLASLLALALLFGQVQQATACKCRRDPAAPPEGSEPAIAAALAGSDAVFTGKVTGMQSRLHLWIRIPYYLFLTRGDRDIPTETEERMFRRRVQLEVEEPFKGVSKRKVVLYTGWGGGDCGYEFHRGARYLVYASDWGDGLHTGICYSTKPIERAGSEITVLQQLSDLGR